MTDTTTLSFAEVEAAGLDDWRQLFHALHTRFRPAASPRGSTW